MNEQELLIIARLKNEVSRPVKEIKADFAGLSTELATQDKLTGAQTRQLRTLGTEMRNAQRDTKKLAEEFSSLGSKMTMFLTLPVAALFVYSVKAASDLNEQVQKTNVVFGQFSDQVHTFAATAASSMGLSQRQFEQTAGSIGALLQPIGIGQQQAAGMSTTLTKLAGDLASFYNTTTDDAMAALQSGLVGQVRPLRRYGVELSQTRLQEYAWANGIAHTGQQLTTQQKLLATYGVVLHDTTLAQGDFARTSGGMANQTRIAQAELENAAATLGEKLIPVAIQVLHVVTGIADAFTSLPEGAQTAVIVMLGVGAVVGPLLKVVGAWMKVSAAIKESMILQSLFNRGAVAGAGAQAAGGASGLAGGAAGGVLGAVAIPAAIVGGGLLASNWLDNYFSTSSDDVTKMLAGKTAQAQHAQAAAYTSSLPDWATGLRKGLDEAIDKSAGMEQQSKQTSSAISGEAKNVDELVTAYTTLSKEIDATAASYDAVLGKFLNAQDAQASVVDNVQKLADSIMKPVADSGVQARTLAADARNITRSIEANVLAQQKAGTIASGDESFFGAQVAQLTALKKAYPEVAGQLDSYIRKLQEGYTLAQGNKGSFASPGPGHFGGILDLAGIPTGDTASPRGWDGGSSSFADTMAIHQRLDAMVPGSRMVTSGLRGAGTSDHAHGRALDLVGSNLSAYATAVRKIGGFAEFHGRGAGRHLHVVPQTGPPAASRGGSPVSFGDVIVQAPIDLENAVARGVRAANRDLDERH